MGISKNLRHSEHKLQWKLVQIKMTSIESVEFSLEIEEMVRAQRLLEKPNIPQEK